MWFPSGVGLVRPTKAVERRSTGRVGTVKEVKVLEDEEVLRRVTGGTRPEELGVDGRYRWRL